MSYPGSFGGGQGYAPLDHHSSPQSQQYESPGTYSEPPFFTSGVGNASSGVGNASGRGSASYSGFEMQARPHVQHGDSVSSLSSWTNPPGPHPGPPHLASVNQRPLSIHHDGLQSPSYSSTAPSRPALPPRESVHFADPAPRPNTTQRQSNQTAYETASTLFPSPGTAGDEQPFLLDPINKVDTFYTHHQIPYEDHSGRQLRHILIGSSFRFLITAALCAAYILSVISWRDKGVQSEGMKRTFNAVTTAISIALGLNLMSAFKDLALNMRWPILSAKKRNLVELDLILRADSLIQLSRLAYMSKRPIVIVSTILWLLINIAAQGGIAMLNLTYGFETDTEAVLMTGKNVSISDMNHFWPQGNNTNPSIQDEEYMAHLYGGLAYNYGLNETKYMPKAGDYYRSSNAMLWFNIEESYAELIFTESSPSLVGGPLPPAIYSDRKIRVDYACTSNQVTNGGNGKSKQLTVANVGTVNISHTRPDFTTFFTEKDNLCSGDQRCSIVQVFEASETRPWYYSCSVKFGQTINDPNERSQITDQMAYVAGSSIAQMGYADDTGQEAQYYPRNSLWGILLDGDREMMGQTVATFALGSIAGASLFNPPTYFEGNAPSEGFHLEVRHPKFFYLIIGLLCGCQLLFCVIVAILSNRVMVGPDAHLDMALLLKPIADALEGVSNGKHNSAFRDAKKDTMVRYEKSRNGRWILNMKL